MRALLFGTTGVEKAAAAEQLRRYARTQDSRWELRYWDFEHEFIQPTLGRGRLAEHFDQNDRAAQRSRWLTAWRELLRRADEEGPEVNLLVGMHASLIRPIYGVTSTLDLRVIGEFGATHIVTLMDDIYSVYRRTSSRAGLQRHVGVPSLTNLLEGRRTELLLADLVADHSPRTPTNWLVAARHPARLLYRLLVTPPSRLKAIYLSFPISEPRRMARGVMRGPSGPVAIVPTQEAIDEVNSFLSTVTRIEREEPLAAVFCPLTIDELPFTSLENFYKGPHALVSDREAGVDAPTYVAFDPPSERWRVEDFYGEDLLLASDRDGPEVEVPEFDMKEARGQIQSDVGRRDYRLVKQADSLVVFNPVMNGRMPRGVHNEIVYASRLHKPVQVFQDRNYDPLDITRAAYEPTPGQMGAAPDTDWVVLHATPESAFRAAVNL